MQYPKYSVAVLTILFGIGVILVTRPPIDESPDFDSVTVIYNCPLVLKNPKNIPEDVVEDCMKMREESGAVVNESSTKNVKYI